MARLPIDMSMCLRSELLDVDISQARPRGDVRSRFSVIIAAGLLLAGCAVPTSYMGISFTPGAADPDLQSVARRAMSGDKRAQLELGNVYEEGHRVSRNTEFAKRLYAQAATDTGGRIWVYLPPSGKARSGRVVAVETGPKKSGLAAATALLLKNDKFKDRSSPVGTPRSSDWIATGHVGEKIGNAELAEAAAFVEEITQSDRRARHSLIAALSKSLRSPEGSAIDFSLPQRRLSAAIVTKSIKCNKLDTEFRQSIADCEFGEFHYSIKIAFRSPLLGACQAIMGRLFEAAFHDAVGASLPEYDPYTYAPPPHPPNDPPRSASRGNHLLYMIDESIQNGDHCAYGMTLHFR